MTETSITGFAYPLPRVLSFIRREAMKYSIFTKRMVHLNYVKYWLILAHCFLLFPLGYTQLSVHYSNNIEVGADQLNLLLPKLKGKKTGMCLNHTSLLRNGAHLIDTLVNEGIKIEKIYTPEHGLRGKADAGEKVAHSVDDKTGIPIVSLYGKNKKPSTEQLHGIDVMVFDLQDVGARFYTYISTLHYIMESCAENKIPVIVLDRPNPNGFYVDGPVLDTSLRSFVGMHPIPIVHGMTIGEYAQMINGEGWLKSKNKCDLTIVTCLNYTHKSYYNITTPPSPNLTSMQAIYYYPTTCLLEGTCLSVGRGTSYPFRNIGMPGFKKGKNYFTPQPGAGAKAPVYNGQKCRGLFINDSLVNAFLKKPQIDIDLLKFCYANVAQQSKFFTEKGSFNILAGTKALRQQLARGLSSTEIRQSWQADLAEFKRTRKKYLLYPDFE